MISDPTVRVIFTALFIAIAGYLGYRAVEQRRRPVQVIGDLAHLVMALVMAAMAWHFWRMLPWTAQLVFFGAATLWFIGVAVALRVGRFEPDQLAHPAWHQVVHAVMMASMVWMVAVMPPGGHHHAMSPLEMGIGYALTAAMLVAAVAFAVGAARHRDHKGHRTLDTVVMIAMLLGMSWMNWLMF